MQNIAKNKWRWCTYNKLMNRSGLWYLTSGRFYQLLTTVINRFVLKGSARRWTSAPAPPALSGARLPGSPAKHSSRGSAFAPAMKELLLSCTDARGCYLDAFLCKEAPEGLLKDWWDKEKVNARPLTCCTSRQKFRAGKVLKGRKNFIFLLLLIGRQISRHLVSLVIRILAVWLMSDRKLVLQVQLTASVRPMAAPVWCFRESQNSQVALFLLFCLSPDLSSGILFLGFRQTQRRP